MVCACSIIILSTSCTPSLLIMRSTPWDRSSWYPQLNHEDRGGEIQGGSGPEAMQLTHRVSSGPANSKTLVLPQWFSKMCLRQRPWRSCENRFLSLTAAVSSLVGLG